MNNYSRWPVPTAQVFIPTFKSHKKVFVLVDEYDAVQSIPSVENDLELSHITSLVVSILSEMLESNNHVERVLVTGVSYIAGA